MLPDLYFFNPTCEPAIANGSPFYTAQARLRKFEADLGYLPGWLGEEKDQVLVQGTKDVDFESRMSSLGFRLPEFLNLVIAFSDPAWMIQPKGRFCPWGWSPAVYQLFANVLPTCCDEFRLSPVVSWKPEHKNLYSRLTAIVLLDEILRNSALSWLTDPANLPVVCTSLHQIHLQVARYHHAVVKSPWSSSGRGLLLFPNVDSKKKNEEVLSGMLNQQHFVTVEPWFDKVMDLSYQFYSFAGRIIYKGRTRLETDHKGRYIRNFLGDDTEKSSEIFEFLEEHNSEIVTMLLTSLSGSDYAKFYEGWIGVDALIYRDEAGGFKFHPMIEINGRFTMGAIALKIREYLAFGSHGFMQLFYSNTVNFQSFCRKQEVEKPLIMADRKIVSGFLPLTPPLPQHQFGAYIEVSCR